MLLGYYKMTLPRKYQLWTSDNLYSKKFLVTNSDTSSENCQLLRDIDFSVLAKEEDIFIRLRLYDEDKELIVFNYKVNKDNPLQIFRNDKVKLVISFSYQQYTRNREAFILCCPSFTIIKHPDIWSKISHYGQCGQSCPCCRAHMGETLGTSSICKVPY